MTEKKKAKKKVPQEIGRPTKYKPEYCQKLIEHMALGYSYEAFAGKVDVAIDTLYNWEQLFPDFSEAKKEGKAKQRTKLEEYGMLSIAGYNTKLNTAVWAMFMKNCCGWHDGNKVDEDNPIPIKVIIERAEG